MDKPVAIADCDEPSEAHICNAELEPRDAECLITDENITAAAL